MAAGHSSENSVNIYRTTWRHIQGDNTFRNTVLRATNPKKMLCYKLMLLYIAQHCHQNVFLIYNGFRPYVYNKRRGRVYYETIREISLPNL
jgi:hypothetical protein